MKHPTQDSRPCYRAYLLRLWREPVNEDASPPIWRFSLEDPATHQRRGFDSLEALAAFLANETLLFDQKEPDPPNTDLLTY